MKQLFQRKQPVQLTSRLIGTLCHMIGHGKMIHINGITIVKIMTGNINAMKRNAKSNSKFLNALLLCTAFAFLLIGAGLAVNNVLAQYHSTEKTLIPVTEDIRESIYKENDYFKDLPYLDGDFLSYTDFNISDKTAEHVTKLTVDMQRTDSLAPLCNLPSLQTIDI